MSKTYFIRLAESCRELARDEQDALLKSMLEDLADDYAAKAEHAEAAACAA
jgi:hypothetical protein